MGSTTPAATSNLFRPLKLGPVPLAHRIAMAPLTRYRASDSHVPTDMMRDYYSQRAAVPGTFIITEGTIISPQQGGLANAPGIYSKEQIDAWRPIVDAVHARGSHIFSQLWAIGRAANPEVAEREGFVPTTSSTPAVAYEAPMGDWAGAGAGAAATGDKRGKQVKKGSSSAVVPRAMSREEIQQTVRDYVQAARNAIEAGFDGVEIHGANGYLVDQFTQDVANQRTDEYGGSVGNRSRFVVEVMGAVVEAVGAERTALRLSPFNTFGGMGMEDPVGQFSDVIQKVGRHNLAYLHLVEPRVSGLFDIETSQTLDFAFEAWKGTLLIAGGHTPASARRLVDIEHPDRDIVVVFGRRFLSNPDLPFRISKGIELTPWDRETFYRGGAKGYVDYPYSREFEEGSRQ
jgi:NADPH2 dehydrogenase